jgi:hypothetical protein
VTGGLEVVNLTTYRSEHLRAFAERARLEVPRVADKFLVVGFRPSRGRARGLATVNGTRSTIWLPKAWTRTPDDLRLILAKLLVHEFAHNGGARGERWMRASAQYGFRHPAWRGNVLWSLALPLEHRPGDVVTAADRLRARSAACGAPENNS